MIPWQLVFLFMMIVFVVGFNIGNYGRKPKCSECSRWAKMLYKLKRGETADPGDPTAEKGTP